MRTIKFRAWNLYTGTWHREPLDNSTIGYYWENDTLIFKLKNDIELTFQQYSGLKDKEGKEIYEGDILSVEYFDSLKNEDIKSKDVVCFENGCFAAKYFELYLKEGCVGWVINDSRKVEIIGNIFQNPELLEPAPKEKA